MTAQRLPLDGVISSSNLTGATVANLDDDPDSPDTNWATADADQTDTVLHVSFGTPTATLTSGADLQEFRVQVRQSNPGGNTPTVTLSLYEAGSLVRAASAVNVTQAFSQVVSMTWNATELADSSGADVQLYITGTAQGGSPSNRNSVEIGAVEWNADYTAAVNVTETTGSPDALTVTGYAPTVTVSSNVTETTGGVDALTITGQQPTVSTDVLVTTGSPDALTITGQQPTVVTSTDFTVTTGNPRRLVVNVDDAYTDVYSALYSDVLEAYFKCSESSGTVLDDATGGTDGSLLNTGTIEYQESAIGRGSTGAIGFTTSSDYGNLGTTRWNYIHNTADFTVAFWVRIGSTAASVGLLASSGSVLHKGLRIDLTAGGVIQGILTNGATSKILTSTTTVSSAGEYFIVFTGDGSNLNLYVNGGAAEDTDTAITGTGDATNALILGAQAGLTGQFDGDIEGVAFFTRGLTQAEANGLYEATLLKRPSLTMDALVTTGSPDALTVAGQQPTVSADALVTTGSPDALSITGYAPTVTTTTAVNVTETTAGVDALSITGQAPTVAADMLVTTGGVDELTVTGQAPTVSTDVLETTGGVDALTITGYAPTVTTTTSVDVLETTAGVDALTVTGQAPTVAADALVTTGSPDALSVTGQAPTVSADVLVTTGSPDALSVTGYAPTVTTSASASVTETTAGPDALTITGYAPTVSTDTDVTLTTAGVDALAITGQQPTISADALVTTGSPDALTVAGQQPAVSADALVTTGSPDALSVTGYAPTVTVSDDIAVTTGNPDALSVTGYAPTVVADVNVTTGSPDALLITGLAPDVAVAPYQAAPASRTIYVGLADRSVAVRAEVRTLRIPAGDRAIQVKAESRVKRIPADFRTITVIAA